MNYQQLKYLHGLLIKAAVANLEVPLWRFDGEAIRNLNELALTLGVPQIEAKALLSLKDVYGGSGAGVFTRGVGSKPSRTSICQRANALAYGHRRRRRRKKEKQ